jgi:hypothetical protein
LSLFSLILCFLPKVPILTHFERMQIDVPLSSSKSTCVCLVVNTCNETLPQSTVLNLNPSTHLPLTLGVRLWVSCWVALRRQWHSQQSSLLQTVNRKHANVIRWPVQAKRPGTARQEPASAHALPCLQDRTCSGMCAQRTTSPVLSACSAHLIKSDLHALWVTRWSHSRRYQKPTL